MSSPCTALSCPYHGIPCRSVNLADCLTWKALDRRIEELMDMAAVPRIFVPAPPHLRALCRDEEIN